MHTFSEEENQQDHTILAYEENKSGMSSRINMHMYVIIWKLT